MKLKKWLFLLISLFSSNFAHAELSQKELDEKLFNVISQDRTGACIQVAIITQAILKSSVCANDQSSRVPDFNSAFEIGSVSKPMTSVVLAGLVDEGLVNLDDTLESLLPEGVKVPTFKGNLIRLRHVITHSSGLPAIPSLMDQTSIDNPYSKLNNDVLFDSLKDVVLTAKPGENFAYSNYAMILLSLGLSHKSGKSFDELLDKFLFNPIGMTRSYALTKPAKVKEVQGHRQTGQIESAWTFPQNYHGAGGIRSSMNDMVKFVQANLGAIETPFSDLLTMTHKAIASPSGQSMGMNWMRIKFSGRNLITHEGATGGFSSLISIDLETKIGIIILSDTSLVSLGGLFPLASHLIEPTLPEPKPRLEKEAPITLINDISGEYALPAFGLQMKLWAEDKNLMIQATGQNAFKMRYDSHGTFYPLDFDALLIPVKSSTGMTFDWVQSGATSRAQRTSLSNQKSFQIDKSTLTDYIGVYPLSEQFELRVMVKDNELYIQGTGQQGLPVVPVSRDEFSRDDVGAYFTFRRDKEGKVVSLILEQAGQSHAGKKK